MPELDPITVLTEARAKIADPDHWTKSAFARRDLDGGLSLAPNDENATCYCALGAVMCVSMYDTPMAVHDALRAAADELIDAKGLRPEVPLGVNPTVFFNDHPDTTHDEALRMFDLAIDHLTPKEAS